MSNTDHWNHVYKTKKVDQLSWTQEAPTPSIDWIKESLPDLNQPVIDVGGGNSVLVDALLQAGYVRPTVLDISFEALNQAKSRLGERSAQVEWIESDILHANFERPFALWHDRAVFHFLTSSTDRARYVETLRNSLAPHGKVIIATFSPHGPTKCSGLDIVRFDEKLLSTELGSDFCLKRTLRVEHTTPWQAKQEFTYCLFEALF